MLELQVQRHNHCTGCDGVEGSSRGLEEGNAEAIQVHSQISTINLDCGLNQFSLSKGSLMEPGPSYEIMCLLYLEPLLTYLQYHMFMVLTHSLFNSTADQNLQCCPVPLSLVTLLLPRVTTAELPLHSM